MSASSNMSEADPVESGDPHAPSRSIVSSVLAGLVAGLLAVTFMFSYSAVILTGDLAPFVPRLTGHFLLGGVILALVVGLRSQYFGVVALPQSTHVLPIK